MSSDNTTVTVKAFQSIRSAWQDASLRVLGTNRPRKFARKLACGLVPALLVATTPFTSTEAADIGGADKYFHRGSNNYIDKEAEKAKEICAEGLKTYPKDAKLQALKKLLEQQQKQKNQKKQQKQQNQDKQNKDQKQKDKQQNKDKQKRDKQDQKRKQNQEQQQQHQKQREQDQKSKQKRQEQGAKREAKQMKKEEAQQILDAMKEEEKAKRKKMRIMLGKPQPVEKNW